MKVNAFLNHFKKYKVFTDNLMTNDDIKVIINSKIHKEKGEQP